MSTDNQSNAAGRDAARDESRGRPEGNSPLAAINRRRFLAYTSGGFLGAVGSASGAPATAAKPAKPAKLIDIGPLKNFSKAGISEDFTQHNFFVIRYQDRVFAASTACTHMGNDLFRDPQDDTRIKCSGHESVFDAEGRVVVGPAVHGLTRLGVSVNKEGNVLVDPARKFPEDQWGEKGSSLAIE